eukprot:TRINITY_DN6228_c0_g2_i1.p1 TRINITY_DN6228_c0_g2~~TRINITY_DN6228_c0_g2_i1.p1  ORF type:complete len:309 (+),score=102.48 TRINITY_DN6228_c0_g2_i1:23-949(+)
MGSLLTSEENVQSEQEEKDQNEAQQKQNVKYVDVFWGEEKKLERFNTPGSNQVQAFPIAVEAPEIIAKQPQAQALLYQNLKTRGYCPIKVDPSVKETSSRLSQVGLEYLAQELEVKKVNSDPDGNNLGYVHIPGVREYIKLRTTDPSSSWPTHPPQFQEVFKKFFDTYAEIAFASFDLLAAFEEDSKPLIPKEHADAVREFLPLKSSVSLIKYYALEKDSEVCAEHTDTGILTFITRTNRPSLEIWDNLEGKYVQVEQFLEEGDLVVFVSEKVPLFAASQRLPSSPHRVRMEAGPERISIAFLLDVAK